MLRPKGMPRIKTGARDGKNLSYISTYGAGLVHLFGPSIACLRGVAAGHQDMRTAVFRHKCTNPAAFINTLSGAIDEQPRPETRNLPHCTSLGTHVLQ